MMHSGSLAGHASKLRQEQVATHQFFIKIFHGQGGECVESGPGDGMTVSDFDEILIFTQPDFLPS